MLNYGLDMVTNYARDLVKSKFRQVQVRVHMSATKAGKDVIVTCDDATANMMFITTHIIESFLR